MIALTVRAYGIFQLFEGPGALQNSDNLNTHFRLIYGIERVVKLLTIIIQQINESVKKPVESIFEYNLCCFSYFLVLPQLKESSFYCVRLQEKHCKMYFRV